MGMDDDVEHASNNQQYMMQNFNFTFWEQNITIYPILMRSACFYDLH